MADAEFPGSRVRVNLLQYLQSRYQSTTTQSRILMISSVIFLVLQILLITVVLSVSAAFPQTCDVPLQMFLGVYLVRSVLALPLTIWQHLHSSGTARAGENNAFWDAPDSDNWERIEREASVTKWVDRGKSLLDLFTVAWFLTGNFFVFSSLTCRVTSPMLFYSTLTLIILGYLLMSVPILLCGAVVFCLPCVLLAMRHVRLPGVQPSNSASEAVIKGLQLRTVKIKNDSTDTPSDVVIQPTPQWWNPLRRHLSKSFGTLEPLELSKEDAHCVICLASYQDQENVKVLGCGHHYHPECVDEWLRINRKCPLCVRDVTEMQPEVANRRASRIFNPFRRNQPPPAPDPPAIELPVIAVPASATLNETTVDTIGIQSAPSIAPSFRTSIDGLIVQRH
jgi:hypothetical protein